MSWRLLLLTCALPSVTVAQNLDAAVAKRREVVAQALAAAQQADPLQAAEIVEAQSDVRQVAQAYLDLQAAVYERTRDIPTYVAVGWLAARCCLREATRAEAGDAKLARGLRGAAMALTYNLAANTWPGWDEPGIVLTESDLAAGLSSAKAHVAIADCLQVGDIGASRAQWILGAQLLAAEQYAQAGAAFAIAAKRARAAGQEAEALNAEACGCLAGHLADRASAEAKAAFEAALARLDAAEQDDFFTQQVRTAARVFERGE